MSYDFTAASSQYLSVASAPVATWPLTIACWFNIPNATTQYALVSLGKSNAEERFVLQAAGHISGDPIATNYIEQSAANYRADSTTGFTANTWNHACGVHSSASLRTAYLNGGSGGSSTATATLSNSGINTTFIGAQPVASGVATYLSGKIAEVGIWNVALTADEIASLAKGITCDKIRPQSLVFHAPIVRDLIDTKGGLTITNNNSATVADHPRNYG